MTIARTSFAGWLVATPALALCWAAADGDPGRQRQAAWLLIAVAVAAFGVPFVATLVALDRGHTGAGLVWFVVAVLAVAPALTMACRGAGELRVSDAAGAAASSPARPPR
ncbi:hypothetical protein [Spirilliplanes yamanashiensis]|uniref:hypothetical protein n=1 Tax=Spirilliplanes yamanashiensis TaxID=42233 RepID=UPI00195065EF|nr:hypothetical protein [Spirilliplanes yamanashiensis]MDP9816600.1 hypothetical protein [Spirilliplanes yamanashiensis]